MIFSLIDLIVLHLIEGTFCTKFRVLEEGLFSQLFSLKTLRLFYLSNLRCATFYRTVLTLISM